MGMGINKARSQGQTLQVDHLVRPITGKLRAHLGNAVVVHQHIAHFGSSAGAVVDPGILQ